MRHRNSLPAAFFAMIAAVGLCAGPAAAQPGPDVIHQPYQLDTGLVSRSISFENPTGRRAKEARRPANSAPPRALRSATSSPVNRSSCATSRGRARFGTSG